jgi:hypothetical protein
VIFNLSSSCTGSNNFTWNNSTQALTVGSGSATGVIDAYGGFAVPSSGSGGSTASNAIQCVSCGGLFGLGVSAQAFYPSIITSPMIVPGAGYGGLIYQGTGLNYWFWNFSTTAWDEVNLATLGSGCTVTGTAGNVVFLNTGGTTCTNNTNLTFLSQDLGILGSGLNTAALSVHMGYIETQGGLLADGENNWNLIQAVGITAGGCTASYYTPCAGISAYALFASKYTQIGASAGAPTSLVSFVTGAAYYDSTAHCLEVYSDPGATPPSTFGCVSSGGSASPGGAPTNIQFYSASGAVFAGSANFTYASGNVILAGGSFVTSGNYGFDAANCAVGNCIQAPSGGVTSLTATIGGPSTQFPSALAIVGTSGGSSSGSQRAALAWETAGGAARWTSGIDINGNGDSTANNWFLYSSGGPTFVIEANYTTGNIGIGGAPLGGAGQKLTVIGTSGAAGISVSSGFIQATGSNSGFYTDSSSTTAIQAPNGTITGKDIYASDTSASAFNTPGGYNSTTAASSASIFSVRGFTIIDANANASFGGSLSVSGASAFASGATFNGGIVTNTSANSSINIDGTGSGNFYVHVVSGASTGISCSGIKNGWMGITTSDNYLVVCDNTGSRYRAALSSY